MDLSSPKNSSVNDGIDPTLSSLSYASINHLSTLIQSLGRGAMLVKTDIKEAYCMIPVHPQDQWLLGIQWEVKMLSTSTEFYLSASNHPLKYFR